jgi:hypothetical protein
MKPAPRSRTPQPATLAQAVAPALRSPAQTLDAGTRAGFERAFDTSFADVRIHAAPPAGRSALALGAAAWTVGRDIVFAPGAYAPHTPAGKRLLAHELAHVAQGGSRDEPVQRLSAPDAAHERQADRLAEAAARGERPHERPMRRPHGSVSRSLLGAGIGGGIGAVVGAVAGGLLGSLLGPAGAAIGAIAGGVGGLLLGGLIGHFASEGGSHDDSAHTDAPAAAAPEAEAAPPAAPETPRPNYVFIMGADDRGSRNPFYAMALDYYRTQQPGATFVTDQRSLSGVLGWLAGHGSDPIGEIFLVSHANEDGTLSFGLDAADRDGHLTVRELREALHPAGGGASRLPSVARRIDARTRVHIKGCDIGRTQAMLELVDEAFGGAGTVDAPTHEQVFGNDPTLARRAREAFRERVRAGHPLPPEIDPALRGAARTRALAERRTALRERDAAIRAELRERRPEEDAAADQAGHYTALSGPMFQRPGTQLFSARELQPEVDRLYGHLPLRRRQRLVQQLITPDGRREPARGRLSTVGQHGQRVDRFREVFVFPEPRSVAEANASQGAWLRRDGVTLTSVGPTRSTSVTGGETLEIPLTGTQRTPDGRVPWSGSVTAGSAAEPIPTQAVLDAQARRNCPNPDRYQWRFDETHAGGQTTRRMIGERVLAYLHHGSLDAGDHEHFNPATSDRNFYASSTFAPAGAPAGGGPTP